MPKKPVIGVVPLVDYGRESLWMLPGYFDAVLEAGGVPVMLPLSDDGDALARALDAVDGLVVTGGQDVDPARYGEKDPEAAALCGELCRERDAMEALLVPAALERDLPLLGICRGLQALNVVLGGTLWQDLPKQLPSEVEHHGKAPYENPVHEVGVLPGTPLAVCVGEGRSWRRRRTVWSRPCGARPRASAGPCSGTPSSRMPSTSRAARSSRRSSPPPAPSAGSARTGEGVLLAACASNDAHFRMRASTPSTAPPDAALRSGIAHRPLLSSGIAHGPALKSGTERRGGARAPAR